MHEQIEMAQNKHEIDSSDFEQYGKRDDRRELYPMTSTRLQAGEICDKDGIEKKGIDSNGFEKYGKWG